MPHPRVVIITGPVASGTSAVAAVWRASGMTVAVVELDRMYKMLDDRPSMDDPHAWRKARRAGAALVDAYILDGIDLVIVSADVWTDGQREEFTNRITTGVETVSLTLETPHMTTAEVAARITSALDRSESINARAPLFKDVDCIQIPVPDLDAGLAFYQHALGQRLIWRSANAAGLRLADSATELVLHTERPELEPNLSVTSADEAATEWLAAGGTLLAGPFDIPIGRCAIVQDQWSNRLVLLDHQKGRLLIDAKGQVRLDDKGQPLTQAAQ